MILAAYEERRPYMTDDQDMVDMLHELNDRFEDLSISGPRRAHEEHVATP